MPSCGFCSEEFDKSSKLRDHIESEHRDEAKEEMKSSGWKKKHVAVKYSFTLIVILAAGLIIPQVLNEASEAERLDHDLEIDGNPMLGEEKANATIIFFGDYKCTTCSEVNKRLTETIYKEFIESGKAKLYFLNYDYLNTEEGESSTRAALAGECMYKQDATQFWNYHNTIYREQGLQTENWATKERLMELARDSTENIDYQALKDCISSRETLKQVNIDKRKGIEMSVGHAPAVFVNKKQIKNPSVENIENALRNASTK